MPLTTDQTALLQATIENLNRSVEINNEVLELMKSIGNTGIVDIATHNTDRTAHPFFNKLVALQNFYLTPYTDGPTQTGNLGGSLWYMNVVNDSQQLVNRHNYYGCWGNTGAKGSVTLINGYARNPDYSENFADKDVISMLAYGWTTSSGENSYKLLSSFSLGQDQDSRGSITFGLNDESYGNATHYHMKYGMFLGTRTCDLGSSTYQWKDCYLTNSPIVSSDRRLKQNFESVPEAVFTAWGNVNFQVYKFKEAVAKKGEANARKHIGLVAQDIIEAFQAQDLDAFDYGIVCHDSWEDQYERVEVSHTPEVLDEQGNVVTPENTVYENQLVKPAGDVYTVRYEEALALEAAYQRWKLAKIEQALTAKGITL